MTLLKTLWIESCNLWLIRIFPCYTDAARREEAGQTVSEYLPAGSEGEHQVLVLQQLAGVGDVDGRLGFVPRQHPQLHASPSQSRDGLGDTFLETVLDARGPCERLQKVRLHFSLQTGGLYSWTWRVFIIALMMLWRTIHIQSTFPLYKRSLCHLISDMG